MMKRKHRNRVALVVPHIFLHRDILPNVIFSPGTLAVDLAEGLGAQDVEVTLFTPGPIDTSVPTVHADMTYFDAELNGRGDTYVDLLKKHPFTFVSLARQVQGELLAEAYARANNDEFDLVHIYTNEEDIALPFAKLCKKPVLFTHHDPFNFAVRYKSVFPKYTHVPWISLSYAQRTSMPKSTKWIGNIYHGLDPKEFTYHDQSKPSAYIAYLGRIIEPKGLHLAIEAIAAYNATAANPLTLKIAGKHYAEAENDTYWSEKIAPKLGQYIEYVGFIKDTAQKNAFLGNARALVIPSTFEEPFGMVMIEALASGTPLIGLGNGAIPEIITEKNGILINNNASDTRIVNALQEAFTDIQHVNRQDCRDDFEKRFTLERMCRDHAHVYQYAIESQEEL